MNAAESLSNALNGERVGPNQFTAPCPYHDDKKPSLAISIRDNGSVLAHCHAGCEDVFDRLRRDGYLPHDGASNIEKGPEAEYAYADEHGEVRFWIVRRPEKRFIAEHLAASGQRVLGAPPDKATWMPYRLPQLLQAPPEAMVFVTEGEKDADTLAAHGFVASTNPFGASKWRPQYNRYFAGRDVVVVADNDDAGRRHAEQVVASLRPVARSVRTLDLSGRVAEKGDVSDLIAGGGVEAFNALVEALPPPQLRKPAFYSLADLAALPKTKALVEGLIPHGGFALLYSASGAGKTFVAIDVAVGVAGGQRTMGRGTESGLVMYCSLEGWDGIGRRVQAALAERDLTEGIPFFFRNEPLNLLDAVSVEALIKSVHDASELQQEPAVLVVIDTLARAMPGADENSPGDMGKAVSAIERIQRDTGAAVLVLHHSGKSLEKGARGHSSLRAAADAELCIDQNRGQRNLKVTKQRDGCDDVRIPFELVEVAYGEPDQAGSSMVVRVSGAPPRVAERSSPLSRGAQKVLNSLRQALDAHECCLPSPVAASIGVPAETRVVTREQLAEACRAAGLSKTEGGRGKAIARGLRELGERVGSAGGYLWLTDDARAASSPAAADIADRTDKAA